MSGVAIVTGGTRGIGLDISRALIADEYNVAAVYHGNEDAAQKFRDETGHSAYKFDVSDYEACEKWVEQIEKDLEVYFGACEQCGYYQRCYLA